MARGGPYIELRIDVDQPLHLGDFVHAFTALGAEYERYSRLREPDTETHASLYVQDIKEGSIVAHLIPDLYPALLAVGGGMAAVLAIEDFIRRYGSRLRGYITGTRAEDATKSELKDFARQVAAISHNPGSRLSLAAIEVKEGEREVRAFFEFNTEEARAIEEHVELHAVALEHQTGNVHERVVMVFTRSDVRGAALGHRSGEWVRIEEISHRARPLIYQSDLAEEKIKYEIVEADDNVYKKGFIVDVAVEERNGRVFAYRVLHLHQVIDLPDDDDPEFPA